MSPGPSLSQSVHRLIRVHHTMNNDGGFTKQAALLDQLADAVHNSTASRSGGSNERGLPFNSDAVDLQQHIQRTTHAEEQHRTGDTGTTRSTLYFWGVEERTEWQAYLATITEDFCNRITQLLNPTPPRRPLRQKCPACQTTWAQGDNEQRKYALTARVYDPEGGVLPTEEWDISCSECAAQWTPEDPSFKYVLESLNPSQESMIR